MSSSKNAKFQTEQNHRSVKVFVAPGSHPAIKQAALRLVANQPDGIMQNAISQADFVIGTASVLQVSPLPERSFQIFRKQNQIWIVGDRPRSVLAGALYFLHHTDRETLPSLPFKRTSPFRERLILEDFPFHCYAPTGLEFDPRRYAENLVALGFTSMECNRYSTRQPLAPYYANYQFTNPSLAQFTWTRWHKGVWEPEIVQENADELALCIRTALEFDLDPAITSFLPRPYPETFFVRHPHLRGPAFRHEYLVRGNHPTVHCLNMDHPEALEFYQTIYGQIFEAHPEIRHCFFWHADLGTSFWPDGEGPKKRSQVSQIAEFHEHFQTVLRKTGVNATVWVNPWQMNEDSLDKLNQSLPNKVGYSVKESAGIIHFCGTSRMQMKDLNIFSAALGEVPRKILSLAGEKRRRICLGQYLDFSEDLDPILGVSHPLITFRKFHTLRNFDADTSSANWGILSPDLSRNRVNQDVIREMTWGANPTCFTELLPFLMPAGAGDQTRADVYKAWRKIDIALQTWPQFWGLRLQDSGLRLRWLIKPFLLSNMSLPESSKAYYLNHQIYRYDASTPFKEFMEITAAQAKEVATCYGDMIDLLNEAEHLLKTAAQEVAQKRKIAAWIFAQVPPTRWLRLFFTTYRNLMDFHCTLPVDRFTETHGAIIRSEIENTKHILAHLNEASDVLVIARKGKWGQCFGADLHSDFQAKLLLLSAIIENPSTFIL
jgi:hypothetical protein